MLTLWLLTALAADADPFRPSGSLASGHGTLQGESPLVDGQGFAIGVHTSLAQNLIPGSASNQGVSTALPVEFQAGWTDPDSRVRFNLFLPVYAWVDAPTARYAAPALGDIRLQGNITLVRRQDIIALSLIPRLEIPSGTPEALTARGFGGGAALALGGESDIHVGWTANLGVSLSPEAEIEAVPLGSTLDLLAGVWWRFAAHSRLGVEVDGRMGLTGGREANQAGAWHGFLQSKLGNGVGLTVGAGTGLGDGVGSPTWRMAGALTFQPNRSDSDSDGIDDRDDLCPTVPEDLDGFDDGDGCPDLDNDSDGINDASDLCPNDPEDEDGYGDFDGCPEPDNDGDGVLDTEDGCPDHPGVRATEGCPDDVGSTAGARVEGDRIVFDGPMLFEPGTAVLLPESQPRLNEVARLMLDDASIRRVEVGGHTDNHGDAATNLELSSQRAAAIQHTLLAKGVSRSRVGFKGYGETQPIDTNRTARGRAQNRRIEFLILKRDTTGTATEDVPLP